MWNLSNITLQGTFISVDNVHVAIFFGGWRVESFQAYKNF